MDAYNAFHDHLDSCPQCRVKPFDLCPVGASLLRQTDLGYGVRSNTPPPIVVTGLRKVTRRCVIGAILPGERRHYHAVFNFEDGWQYNWPII